MDKIHTFSVYLLLLLLLTLENPKFYHHYFHPLLRCHQGSIQLGHLQWVTFSIHSADGCQVIFMHFIKFLGDPGERFW